MYFLAQYLRTVSREWLIELFGGRWGIAGHRVEPIGQYYTEIWLHVRVARFEVPMQVVLAWIIGGLLTLIGIAAFLVVRCRRRRLKAGCSR